MTPDGFRVSQHQGATLFQRKVKQGNNSLLGVRFQIDQQIAAGDQVHMRKWGIEKHVLRGKDDRGTQVFLDPVGGL